MVEWRGNFGKDKDQGFQNLTGVNSGELDRQRRNLVG